MSERQLPESSEAEMGAIGAMLLDAVSVVPEAIRLGIRAEMFQNPAHRAMVETIFRMFDADWKGIDTLTVSERLRDEGVLEKIGGGKVIDKIMDSTPTSAHGAYYLDLVRQKHIQRSMIVIAAEVQMEAYRTAEPDALLASLPLRFTDLVVEREAEASNLTVMQAKIDSWEAAKRGEKKAIGLEMPWSTLTEMMCGLEVGLTFLAARPSVGKTTVEDMICEKVCADGFAVGRISLDSDRGELVSRMLCRKAGVSLPKLKHGFAGESQLAKLREMIQVVAGYKMFIDDRTRDLRGILSRARAWKMKHDIQLLTLDFIQLVDVTDLGKAAWNPVQAMGYVSGALKALSHELEIPILVLSQLSRAIERDGREPQLSDLRDSGSLEQDADKVLFLTRDDKTTKEMEAREPGISKKKRPTIFDLLKHKNGQTGRMLSWFRPHYFLFEQTESFDENYLDDVGPAAAPPMQLSKDQTFEFDARDFPE